MQKIIWSLVMIAILYTHDVSAQPQAKSIAYAPSCMSGVHVYDSAAGAVTCGKPAMNGKGYVIEMATDAHGKAQCPKGYDYVGNVEGRGDALLHFACAKI